MASSTDMMKLTDDPERPVYKFPKLEELAARLLPGENLVPSGRAEEDAALIARCFVQGLQAQWW
jgi:hypothetical protein